MRYLRVASMLLLALGANAQKRFVYLNNQSQPDTITGWLINNSNGSLTQLAGSPFNTGGQGYQGPIESMAIAPTQNGDVLYAAKRTQQRHFLSAANLPGTVITTNTKWPPPRGGRSLCCTRFRGQPPLR